MEIIEEFCCLSIEGAVQANFEVNYSFCRFLPMSDDEDDVKRTVRSLKDKR